MERKNIAIAVVWLIFIALALSPLFMTGMMESTLMDKFADKDEIEFSKQFFSLVKSRNFDAAIEKVDPKIINQSLKENLQKLADLFPNEEPKSIKAVNSTTVVKDGASNINLSLEYEFPSKWVVASLALHKQGSSTTVQGINVQPLNDSIENINRFTFAGKGIIHYATFAIGVFLFLFQLYVIALCINTPIPKRKWLWVIFVLVGILQINFNWATGQFYFNPISIKIPLVQFSRGFYLLPSGILLMVPLGAIVFLFRRKKWIER